MLYEQDHCGARFFDQGENMLMPYNLCASAGMHTVNERKRASDMESLGLTINLYFKMLKYLQWLVFLMFVLQLFAMLLYFSGDAFRDQDEMGLPMKWLALFSFGNLNYHQTVICSDRSVIQASAAKMAEVRLACPAGGYRLQELKQFGLTSNDKVCSGMHLGVSVETQFECSIDSESTQKKEEILDAFRVKCKDKPECTLSIAWDRTFASICSTRIESSFINNIESQKMLLRGTALCQRDQVGLLNQFVSDSSAGSGEGLYAFDKSLASILIVSIDLFSVLCFLVFLARLKYLEKLTISDE